jgi:hypothetical protein
MGRTRFVGSTGRKLRPSLDVYIPQKQVAMISWTTLESQRLFHRVKTYQSK